MADTPPDMRSESEIPPEADPGRVRRWLGRLKRSRHKDTMLGVASFLETLALPIPIELVMVPYMLSHRERIWRIATIVLAGCLLAAVAGYAFGRLFMMSLGAPLLDGMGWAEAWDGFQATFNDYGFLAIIAVGVTPVPFQVAILTAGAAGYPVLLFLAAAAIARGVRYYGLALLVCRYGAHTMGLWHRHKLTASAVAAVIIAAFWGGSALLGGSG